MYKRWNDLWRNLPSTKGEWTINADLSDIRCKAGRWNFPSMHASTGHIFFFVSEQAAKHYTNVTQMWMIVCIQKLNAKE